MRTKPKAKKRQTTTGPAPTFVEPMEPQLVATLPEGKEWAYEVKWDGYRALLLKHGDSIQLLSRNKKSLAADFPGIVATAADLKTDSCLVDGEIVAIDAQGRPVFQELQNRASTKASIVFYSFDLLAINGIDLRNTPLEERKARLETSRREQH